MHMCMEIRALGCMCVQCILRTTLHSCNDHCYAHYYMYQYMQAWHTYHEQLAICTSGKCETTCMHSPPLMAESLPNLGTYTYSSPRQKSNIIPLCILKHYHVQSVAAWNFGKGWDSYLLCRHVRYLCIYALCISRALDESSALQYFERLDMFKIHNRIMLDFSLGLPQMQLTSECTYMQFINYL